MAIIQLLDNAPLPQQLPCVICGEQITPDAAVAGLLDAANRQQFACNGHFWSSHQLICRMGRLYGRGAKAADQQPIRV